MSNMMNDPAQPFVPPVLPVYPPEEPAVDPIQPPDEPRPVTIPPSDPTKDPKPFPPPVDEPAYPDEPLDDPETPSHRGGEETNPDPADEYDQPRASGNLGPRE